MSKLQKKKVDILAFIKCKNSILNGDPDNDGAQRIDFDTGKGLATPPCIKRMIRDYIFRGFESGELSEGFDVLINPNEMTLKQIEESEKKILRKGDKLSDLFYQKYADTRIFGLVAASKNLEFNCKGPAQFCWAETLHPVESFRDSITNVISYSNKEGVENKTMGSLNRIPFGLFEVRGSISACLGAKTGLTEQDVSLVLDGLWIGVAEAVSTLRSDIDTVILVAFEHDSARGKSKSDDCYYAFSWECDSEAPAGLDNYSFVLDENKLPDDVKVLAARYSKRLAFKHIKK